MEHDRNAGQGEEPAEPKISYGEAVKELEGILEQIEDADIDVDALSDAVERAARLLTICRERITKAETKVVQVLAQLEPENAGTDDESQRSESP